MKRANLTENEAQILSLFNQRAERVMNDFRGNGYYTRLFDAEKNIQLSSQEIVEAQTVFSQLMSSLKSYAYDKVKDHIKSPLIPELEFRNFHFGFPLHWTKYCPPEFYILPLKFRHCRFKEGFFFRGKDQAINAGDILFSHIRDVTSVIHLENISLQNLVFAQGSTENFVLYDISAADIRFEDAPARQTLLCSNIEVTNEFRFDAVSTGKFIILNSDKIEKLNLKTGARFTFGGGIKYRTADIINELKNHNIEIDRSEVIIHNCKLAEIILERAHVEVPISISKVTVRGEANFNNCKFENTTIISNTLFLKSPKFHATTLHNDTDLSTMRCVDFESATSHRDYSTLKHLMIGLNAEIEAHRFHAYELKSRNNTVLNWFSLETFSSFVFWLISDYHLKLFRPLINLAFWFFFFAALYWKLDAVDCLKDATLNKNAWLMGICGNDIREAITYSLQQTIWPIGYIAQSEIWNIRIYPIKLVSFFHVIIASLIWFLFIMGIRKRFKI